MPKGKLALELILGALSAIVKHITILVSGSSVWELLEYVVNRVFKSTVRPRQ
jgi:hypothetical protein